MPERFSSAVKEYLKHYCRFYLSVRSAQLQPRRLEDTRNTVIMCRDSASQRSDRVYCLCFRYSPGDISQSSWEPTSTTQAYG